MFLYKIHATVAILFPALFIVGREKSRQVRCKANLDQIGKYMALYINDFGDTVRYPAANGEGFLVALYQQKVISDASVFICPSTEDSNEDGAELATVANEGDSGGPCSYAGRKNIRQQQYPGIFRLGCDGVTPIGADDWGGEQNHENGSIILFLFLDGYTDHIRSPETNFTQDYAYTYDPLTN